MDATTECVNGTSTVAVAADDDDDDSSRSLSTYRSHIQKRHLNLGRYYDGMMRAGTSQLPTHDLRPNLVLNHVNFLSPKPTSSEGVNEETVRQGRRLLDSIANSIDVKAQHDENSEHS